MSNGPLVGIPGKIKTLLDLVTTTRMKNIDEVTPTRMAYLDAKVSETATGLALSNVAADLSSLNTGTHSVQTLTSGTGTWVRPTGVDWVLLTLVGGGGGGGGGRNMSISGADYNYGGGSGGAGEVIFRMPVLVSTDLTIGVGVGGPAGVPDIDASSYGAATAGTAGGISYFGTGGSSVYVVASAGAGGEGALQDATPTTRNPAAGGNYCGLSSTIGPRSPGEDGGVTLGNGGDRAGANGAGNIYGPGGAGATSQGAVGATPAVYNYGAGGGGGYAADNSGTDAAAGGAGMAGIVIVECWVS